MFEAEDWTASEVGQLHGGLLLPLAYCALRTSGSYLVQRQPFLVTVGWTGDRAGEARSSQLAVA